ncbi:MAG: hypothetical protein H0X27_07300 [Caulobacteraceae bacterium]|nr:hypothetical protein [Caulobacteraceae bacterium]
MTTISWKVDADGGWGNAGNWSLGRLPNSADDVVIDTVHFHTVTHGSGTHTVHSLAVGNDDFVVSGGLLIVDTTSSFANRLTVSGGNLALKGAAATGSFDQADGTVSGAGTLTVSGAANFTSTLLQTGGGRTVLEGASNFSGATFGVDGGRVLENKGVFTLTGFGDVELGHNPFGLTQGGGTLKNDAGGIINITGFNGIFGSSGVTSFINAGTLEKTVNAASAVINVALSNTGAVSVQSGRLVFANAFINSGPGTATVSSGATLFLAGGGSSSATALTVASGGSLEFADGTFGLGAGTIGGTTRVTGGGLDIGGVTKLGALVQHESTVSGAGALTVTGPAAFTLDLAHIGEGSTVLKGASTFDGAVFGVDGGRTLENQGTFTLMGSGMIELGFNPLGSTSGGGVLKNDAGGTIDIQGANRIAVFDVGLGASFINAGTLKKTGADTAVISVPFTDTGTVSIANGDLRFLGAGNSFAGLVNGAGRLTLGVGTHDLNQGASLTVVNWSISTGAVVTINEDLAYAGAFSQFDGTTLTVTGGNNLSLTAQSSLAGTVNGAGTVQLSATTLNSLGGRLTLGGRATLNDVGAVDQAGDITIGGTGSTGATLIIAAGATYTMLNDSDIARGNSNKSSLQNSGLLIKSGGTATSVIAVQITDTGAIKVEDGTLDLTRAIKGGGTMAVDAGATLEVDASASAGLDVTFNGADATLALGDPAKFAATIHRFDPGDTIDLLGIKATAAKLGPGDTLVITNGSKAVATLQLAGNHANDVFAVASDGQGGTNITIAAPGPVQVPGHPFIAAMAGFGGGGGPSPAWFESPAEGFRHLFCGPTARIA